MDVRRGIFVAPFGELSDPRVLAQLAAETEAAGWDGFFVWDHIAYAAPVAVADPWVALAAIARATERVRIGPLVTPPPRRRVQKLARETATLDRLSGGRLVFGVGLGGDSHGEFEPSARRPTRASGLGCSTTTSCGSPRLGRRVPAAPVQQPRIPVWLAARWPNRRPVRRAARWDGLFPIDLPGPEALAELAADVRELRRGIETPFDLVVENGPGDDLAPWVAAGATWCLTAWGKAPIAAEISAAIDAARENQVPGT